MTRFALRIAVYLLVLTLAPVWLWPRPAQAQSCDFPVTVYNQDDLNAAIACYNSRTSPGEYQITLGDNILLTASTTPIDNDTDEVNLVIEGEGHRVDGEGRSDVCPFTIVTGTVTMRTITVTGGRVGNEGGGIWNAGTLSLVNSTIISNTASSDGGGILNEGTVSLVNSTIISNTANYGGGIRNFGTVSLLNSTIISNTASSWGGGIDNDGIVSLVNSTIISNTADGGGGIVNYRGSLSLLNSTISSNTADSDSGGGILNNSIVSLVNSTISNNTANDDGGGIFNWPGSQLSLANTIIANSGNGDCVNDGGTVTDGGHNLIEDSANACGLSANPTNGNLIGQPALLGPLQDNGGPTWTHALLPGSPAIDAGNNASVPADITTDQRGVRRMLDGNGDTVPTVDIGAYELFACGLNMTVTNQVELNAAIACFNAATTLGEYQITLAQDIPLTASTTEINNATDEVSLVIDGEGHRVDGEGIFRVRPFTIAPGTVVTMTTITVTGGAVDNWGGGIDNRGTLSLVNTIIISNSANDDGGGIYNEGTVSLVNSTIISNSAILGGGIENYGGTVGLVNSTIISNTASSWGGGIDNYGGTVSLVDTTIISNTADGGGGIANYNGTVSLVDSTISSNTASNNGGGIDNYEGTVSLVNSTISSNTANGLGGGIYNGDGPVSLVNSTISSNTANGLGGGIYNSDGTASLVNTTISNNSAPDGGGIYNELSELSLANTIIANSTNGGDCVNDGGSVTDGGHNLLEDGDNACGLSANPTNGNLIGQPALLDSLQDNGGPTWTHALLPGSPAIDAGNDETCANPATVNNRDQRGIARPQGAQCDIGAFEYLPLAVVTFVKQVTGGAATPDAWRFAIQDGPQDIAPNQAVTLTVGSYTVNETSPDGYTLTAASGVCALVNGQIHLTVTLAGGTCTLVSTRDTGEITFVKQVLGGSATANDWRFTLTSGPPGAPLPTEIAHNSRHELETGPYTLREVGPDGYRLQSAAGACQVVNGQIQLTVTTADDTCTLVSTQAAVQVNEFFAATWVREGQGSGEGSEACVWLALTAAPSGPVTLSATARHGQVTLDKSTITLDATNWNRFDLAQRDNLLCLSAVDDQIDEPAQEQCKDGLSERFGGVPVPNQACGDHLDFVDLAVVNSADPAYGAFTPFVANTSTDLDDNPASIDVLVQDNDTAGLELSAPDPFLISEGEVAAAAATASSYTIRLTSQPTAVVTVQITGEGVTVQPATLTFTPDNWHQPQTVVVTALDDDIDAGDQHVTQLSHSAVSADPAYHGLSVPTLAVTILDDDSAGVLITPTLLTVTVGANATYQVLLTSQPTAVVTVQIAGEGVTVQPATLTFTPDNWQLPQTVTLTGLEAGTGHIAHTVVSSDARYAAQPAATVTVVLRGAPSNPTQSIFLPLVTR
jgi:hypothetical protein